MELMLPLAGCAVIGAVCYAMLRPLAGDLAVLLAVVLCGGLLLGIMGGISALLTLIETLADAANIENALLSPLLKTVGIAVLTSVSSQVCRDAGVGSAATVMELCGGFCALYAALPLVETVLDLIQNII